MIAMITRKTRFTFWFIIKHVNTYQGPNWKNVWEHVHIKEATHDGSNTTNPNLRMDWGVPSFMHYGENWR